MRGQALIFALAALVLWGSPATAEQGDTEVGVNYSLDLHWSANLDLRYMGLRTTGTFVSMDGTRDDLSFSMNPWVVGLGFRYRY